MSSRRTKDEWDVRTCDKCEAVRTDDECVHCRLDLCAECMATPCDESATGHGMILRDGYEPRENSGPSGSYAEHVPGLANGRP
jgi:hypothetical protein